MHHPQEKEDFSKRVYQELWPYFDIYAFHAHGPLAGYRKRQESVGKWIRDSGKDLRTVRICSAETGERSHYSRDGRRTQADTLVKKITYAHSRGNTEFYLWFTLQDYWDMDFGADDSFGLVTSDNRPKPSFIAYNEVIRQLANTVPVEAAPVHPDLESYAFREIQPTNPVSPESGISSLKSKITYVCWPKQPDANLVFTVDTEGPVTITDMFGKTEVVKPDRQGRVLVKVRGYPLYMQVTGQALRTASGAVGVEWLKYPNEINCSAGRTSPFSVELRNVWGKDVEYRLGLMDDQGETRYHSAGRLNKGAVQSLSIPVSPGPNTDVGRYNYSLRFSCGDGLVEDEWLPLSVLVAYPVQQLVQARRLAERNKDIPELPALVLDAAADVHECTYDPRIPKWRDREDLSVVAKFAHDGKGLLLTFDVTDDKHFNTHHDANLWRGDSIQIAVLANGRHIEFTTALTDQGKLLWCHHAPEERLTGRWNDVPVSIIRDNGHTGYRLYIPFEKLGIQYKPGATIRLAFLVNEDDGLGRVRWMDWFKGIGGTKNPMMFGYVRFD